MGGRLAGQQALRGTIAAVVGEGGGRAALDVGCGTGRQSIPLALLGWRVTAVDINDGHLERIRARAERQKVPLDVERCDMRALAVRYHGVYDLVVCCLTLDHLLTDGEIGRALHGMWTALRPGGQCYLRLDDLEHLLRSRPRYAFREERRVPHGRVIRLEDWEYQGENHVVCRTVFLHEDDRRPGNRWHTDVFSYRRRALRRADLCELLGAAGFEEIELLPQDIPGGYYEVLARRPEPPESTG